MRSSCLGGAAIADQAAADQVSRTNTFQVNAMHQYLTLSQQATGFREVHSRVLLHGE